MGTRSGSSATTVDIRLGVTPTARAGVRYRGLSRLLVAGGIVLCLWSLVLLVNARAVQASVPFLLASTFIFLGVGHLALRLATVDGRELSWGGLRYLTGYALTAFVITVMGALRMGDLAFWLALVAAVAGLALALRDYRQRRAGRPSSRLLATEFFVGALLLRIVLQGTQFWRVSGARSSFIQYWDYLFHLAMIKQGLISGLPVHGSLLETGVPRSAYHYGFDSLATVFIKALHLPADAALLQAILPVTLLAFLVAMIVFASAWGRSRLAGGVALAMIGLTCVFFMAPSAIGDGGLFALRYFIFNPPSALGAAAAMTCLALVALAERAPAGATAGDPAGPLVLAGLLAGATVLMKTQVAIVLVPALGLALLVGAYRRDLARRPAAASGGALGAAGLIAYSTTSGQSAAIVVHIGALANFITASPRYATYTAPLRLLANLLQHLGEIGDVLVIVSFVVIALLSWPLLVLAFALWRARRAGLALEPPAPLATTTAAAMAALALLVGLTVAQRNAGASSSWNISWHTIQNLWWLCLCAAAVALARTLRRPVWLTHQRGILAAALCLALLGAATVHGVTGVRHYNGGEIPTSLRVLLQTWDKAVPTTAVVVQHYDTERYSWVSAIGGRQAVLERAVGMRDLFPARTAKLETEIAELYRTADTARATALLGDMKASYALLNVWSDKAPALRKLGTQVISRGDWVVLRVEPPRS